MCPHERESSDSQGRANPDAGGEPPCALPRFADELGLEDTRGEGPSRQALEDLGYSVTVGLLQADLILPLCRSLKDKRGILAKTMNHLRKKHAVSVAEVGSHDIWGRAGLAVGTVSGSRKIAEQTLRHVEQTLENDREVQLVNWSVDLM